MFKLSFLSPLAVTSSVVNLFNHAVHTFRNEEEWCDLLGEGISIKLKRESKRSPESPRSIATRPLTPEFIDESIWRSISASGGIATSLFFRSVALNVSDSPESTCLDVLREANASDSIKSSMHLYMGISSTTPNSYKSLMTPKGCFIDSAGYSATITSPATLASNDNLYIITSLSCNGRISKNIPISSLISKSSNPCTSLNYQVLDLARLCSAIFAPKQDWEVPIVRVNDIREPEGPPPPLQPRLRKPAQTKSSKPPQPEAEISEPVFSERVSPDDVTNMYGWDAGHPIDHERRIGNWAEEDLSFARFSAKDAAALRLQLLPEEP